MPIGFFVRACVRTCVRACVRACHIFVLLISVKSRATGEESRCTERKSYCRHIGPWKLWLIAFLVYATFQLVELVGVSLPIWISTHLQETDVGTVQFSRPCVLPVHANTGCIDLGLNHAPPLHHLPTPAPMLLFFTVESTQKVVND